MTAPITKIKDLLLAIKSFIEFIKELRGAK